MYHANTVCMYTCVQVYGACITSKGGGGFRDLKRAAACKLCENISSAHAWFVEHCACKDFGLAAHLVCDREPFSGAGRPPLCGGHERGGSVIPRYFALEVACGSKLGVISRYSALVAWGQGGGGVIPRYFALEVACESKLGVISRYSALVAWGCRGRACVIPRYFALEVACGSKLGVISRYFALLVVGGAWGVLEGSLLGGLGA